MNDEWPGEQHVVLRSHRAPRILVTSLPAGTGVSFTVNFSSLVCTTSILLAFCPPQRARPWHALVSLPLCAQYLTNTCWLLAYGGRTSAVQHCHPGASSLQRETWEPGPAGQHSGSHSRGPRRLKGTWGRRPLHGAEWAEMEGTAIRGRMRLGGHPEEWHGSWKGPGSFRGSKKRVPEQAQWT